MTMIALGGVIGAGLFVGSRVVIQSAGPAAAISFLITGGLVILVMRMLGEMAVAQPTAGSFYEYARRALGPFAGFLTGWMYWYFWVIVVAIEAIAGADLIRFWLPQAPQWLLAGLLLMAMTVSNLISVRAYGEFEFWLASIKIAAITLFLVGGSLFVAGIWPGWTPQVANLTARGGFMPHGLLPVLTGAVAATGFYFGAEIVTIAAAEAREPAIAVARATNSVIGRVLVFYVGSILLVVAIVPWNSTAIATPYVSALRLMGLPAAAHLMNAVILTAVLSALNSGLYASSRILFSLTRNGDAPQALARVSGRGVPTQAILVGTVFGFGAVVASYVSPGLVFAFLIKSYGTVAIFVYLLIALSELRLRRQLEREAPEKLTLRMWGFPYLTYLAIAGMVAILGAMAFIPDQRWPLALGVVSLMALMVLFVLRQAFGPRAPSAS
ncbi:amino acid permease [Phenylobacterium sp.]|uniref:amino acid permease n=1 Tax=Phenylobacterium sp. TaxID=1871053 RepID=UPI0025DDD0FF|nr:amino acid permease [Phenylobacterium sp.]